MKLLLVFAGVLAVSCAFKFPWEHPDSADKEKEVPKQDVVAPAVARGARYYDPSYGYNNYGYGGGAYDGGYGSDYGYGGGYGAGSYASLPSNQAHQESNAISGDQGVSIATGSSNAGRAKRATAPLVHGYETQFEGYHKVKEGERAGRYGYGDSYGYPDYGYGSNTASQESNSYSGDFGVSMSSGSSTAGRDWRALTPLAHETKVEGGVHKVKGAERESRYYQGYLPGSGQGYRPSLGSSNLATQQSNAYSGYGGTSIASGDATAGRPGSGIGGRRPYGKSVDFTTHIEPEHIAFDSKKVKVDKFNGRA